MHQPKPKMILPTISMSGTQKTVGDDIYDYDLLGRQSIKDWYVEGKLAPDRCAMFEKTDSVATSTDKPRFIHIALSKRDLVKKLTDAGIIDVK